MLRKWTFINLAVAVIIAFSFGCRDFGLSPDSTDNPSDTCDQLRWPTRDEYLPLDVRAEMIWFVQPEYPREAYTKGIEGIVLMQVLIDRCGNVRDAAIAKSSGTRSLDEAARKTAFANRFRPAIMHGRPVACWTYYEVMFRLDRRYSQDGR